MKRSLFQDGTIGDDLVVKPLPSKIRSQIVDGSIDVSVDQEGQPSTLRDFGFEDDDFHDAFIRHTNETDDYEFLDEDDTDVPVKSSNRISSRRRSKREIRSEFHVVFKRKDSQTDHSSDYRKPNSITIPNTSRRGFHIHNFEDWSFNLFMMHCHLASEN